MDNMDASRDNFLVGKKGSSKTSLTLWGMMVHWVKYWLYKIKGDRRIVNMAEFEVEYRIMTRKLARIRKFSEIIRTWENG